MYTSRLIALSYSRIFVLVIFTKFWSVNVENTIQLFESSLIVATVCIPVLPVRTRIILSYYSRITCTRHMCTIYTRRFYSITSRRFSKQSDLREVRFKIFSGAANDTTTATTWYLCGVTRVDRLAAYLC